MAHTLWCWFISSWAKFNLNFSTSRLKLLMTVINYSKSKAISLFFRHEDILNYRFISLLLNCYSKLMKLISSHLVRRISFLIINFFQFVSSFEIPFWPSTTIHEYIHIDKTRKWKEKLQQENFFIALLLSSIFFSFFSAVSW